MICAYCKTPLPDGAELPFDCPCGAHLTLQVKQETTLRELARAVNANRHELGFEFLEADPRDEVL